MNILDSLFGFIYIPFGLLFKGIYLLVGNYGLAIILFAVIAKLAMIPLAVKQEKSRLLMMRVQPKIQQLQAKFKGNTRDPKYMEEMQALYEKEGYSPTSGCLPSLIQLPFIWAIWTAIRNPFSYIFNLSNDKILEIGQWVYKLNPAFQQVVGSADRLASWVGVNQINLYQYVQQSFDSLNSLGLIPQGSALFNNQIRLDFNFLGLSLGDQPSMGSFSILWLFPLISGATSFLVGFVTQRMNNIQPVTGDRTAKTSNNMLLIVMPIVSVFISFGFSVAISMYWIISNLFSLAQAVILPKVMQMRQKAPEPVAREKKLNYNQIEKMEREKNPTPPPTKKKKKKKK